MTRTAVEVSYSAGVYSITKITSKGTRMYTVTVADPVTVYQLALDLAGGKQSRIRCNTETAKQLGVVLRFHMVSTLFGAWNVYDWAA